MPDDAPRKKLDINQDEQFDPADILLAITDSLASLLAEDLIAARKKT